jgi:acyl-CoA reductase-like NAD-dependent aldehyde dehydrogenase
MITAQRIVSSVDPSTGELLETFAQHSPAEIDASLDRAVVAQRSWAAQTFASRSTAMRRVADYLREQKSIFALHITQEMGKPIVDAEAEIEKCAWVCEYYADNAQAFLADEEVASTAARSFIAYQPVGLVLAVMPWNFPFWQVFRFAAPALMAGNGAVLKHASNVTRCALDIASIFPACGLPEGLFTTLIVPGSEVKELIADARIAAVTITGSEPAGVSVASESGRALKKHVLELGGSDAFIVLADADLAQAAKAGARSRFQNAGQTCICAKRFIVEDAVYDDFVRLLAVEAAAYEPGDPRLKTTTMGPLAREDLRDDLARQIDASVQSGARVVVGGSAVDGPGAFFEATVLADVTPAMAAFHEETFGPVAAVVRARDADHAVALANESTFGLGGAVWTRDVERGVALARRIVTGAVFVNGMTASDPRLPFGGVKHSGYGRELSYLGIREFMNVQTIWVGPSQS